MKNIVNPAYWLLALDSLLAKLEGFFLSSILLIALAFAFLQVILRNFFDSGISWADVFTRHLVVWIGFFGATLSTKADQHIRIDALTKVIPKRFLPIVELFVLLFCIAVSFLLFQAAYHFVADERASMSVLFANVPTWYFIVIMPVGFAIITLRYVVKLIEMLYRFGTKKNLSETFKKAEPTEVDISVKIKVT